MSFEDRESNRNRRQHRKATTIGILSASLALAGCATEAKPLSISGVPDGKIQCAKPLSVIHGTYPKKEIKNVEKASQAQQKAVCLGAFAVASKVVSVYQKQLVAAESRITTSAIAIPQASVFELQVIIDDNTPRERGATVNFGIDKSGTAPDLSKIDDISVWQTTPSTKQSVTLDMNSPKTGWELNDNWSVWAYPAPIANECWPPVDTGPSDGQHWRNNPSLAGIKSQTLAVSKLITTIEAVVQLPTPHTPC